MEYEILLSLGYPPIIIVQIVDGDSNSYDSGSHSGIRDSDNVER